MPPHTIMILYIEVDFQRKSNIFIVKEAKTEHVGLDLERFYGSTQP